MEAAAIFAPVQGYPCPRHPSSRILIKEHSTPTLLTRSRGSNLIKSKKLSSRTSAVAEVSAVTSDPAQVEITWQILVGALAGVTPFVVAGIEFGKRIVQQRLCAVCKGSGLILRDNKSYIRCPGCGRIRFPFSFYKLVHAFAGFILFYALFAGGFLPWQSWRRFFTG